LPQTITFDVGATLIEPYPSVGHIYSEVAARHGLKGILPEELNRRFAAAWRQFRNFDYTREGWLQIVDRTFSGLTEVPPSRTFFPALYDHFATPDAWRVFEDVRPTLEVLTARGYKLGVISNWDERLRPLLGRLGLDHFFTEVIISCEVGAPKPDRRIFLRAAEKLGTEPGTILHVGDSLKADIEGAQAAGLMAIELRRDGAATPGKSPAVIRSLRELWH
jgi:putative hydrolase of the HAD superfamily